MKWIALLLISFIIGCQKEFPCPQGFARLEGHEWKALSAGGSVMKYRVVDQNSQAQAAFWNEAILSHFKNEGYDNLKSKAYFLNSKDSLQTQSLSFSMPKSDYLYFVALVVKDKQIHLWEATGPYADMHLLSQNIVKEIQKVYK